MPVPRHASCNDLNQTVTALKRHATSTHSSTHIHSCTHTYTHMHAHIHLHAHTYTQMHAGTCGTQTHIRGAHTQVRHTHTPPDVTHYGMCNASADDNKDRRVVEQEGVCHPLRE